MVIFIILSCISPLELFNSKVLNLTQKLHVSYTPNFPVLKISSVSQSWNLSKTGLVLSFRVYTYLSQLQLFCQFYLTTKESSKQMVPLVHSRDHKAWLNIPSKQLVLNRSLVDRKKIHLIDILLLTSIFKFADASKLWEKIKTFKKCLLADCVYSFKIDSTQSTN
jgi:hypothetical protein